MSELAAARSTEERIATNGPDAGNALRRLLSLPSLDGAQLRIVVPLLLDELEAARRELAAERRKHGHTRKALDRREKMIEQLNRLISASGIDTQKNRAIAMFMAMRQYSENHGSWTWLGDRALVQVFRGLDRPVGNDDRLGKINAAHQQLVASDPGLVTEFRKTFAGSSDDSIRTRYCAWRNATSGVT